MKNTEIKKIKGFSSAYPNACDLKLLPNIDGTWITIQDNVGTSMTIKLSDLSDFLLDKIRAEIDGIEINGQIDEHTLFIRRGEQVKQMALDIIDKYKTESE